MNKNTRFAYTRKAAANVARFRGIGWNVQDDGSVWLNLIPHEDQAWGQEAISVALENHLRFNNDDTERALISIMDEFRHVGATDTSNGGAVAIVRSLINA